MSEILSQAEIEALLNSLNSGDGAPSVSVAAPEPQLGTPVPAGSTMARKKSTKTTISYEVYDFRRPDKFSKDQLRTLQMLHETFARLSGSSLSAYLRTPVSIDLISLEQVPYEEYLRTINQSVFTMMSLPPLTGQAVLEVEFSLIFSIIDRMLGGPGKSFNRSVLTDIERPLIRQVIERMFAGLKSAWEGVVIVNPGIEGMETSAQFVQIAPPSDVVVTILFEVKVGSQRGAMSLCIPYLVLKPITAKLSAQKWFASGNKKQSNQARKLLTYQINHTTVDCAVELGNARMQLKDFIRLREGDMIRLDRKSDDELTLNVGGLPKYVGRPAKNGKNLILNVTGPWEE
jgi:flagellar motor switch protein FliM